MDVGLARVSTLDQDPQLQVAALERAGCDPILAERVSGAAQRRPVRDEALAMVGRGDRLTVWKLDRLGRSLVELQRIIGDLEGRGVAFRSLTESIDTSHAQGRLFFAILAAFAEFERALIVERTVAGKAHRVRIGRHPGGPRRFGVEADHVTVVEAEAALLRDAARRLLAGETANAIVEGWNADAVPTVRGGRWYPTTLRATLQRAQDILGPDTHAAVVRLFTAPDRQRQGRPAQHLLSGILHCTCEQPMYASEMSGHRWAYRCRRAEGSGGRSRGCGKVSVSERAADRWAADAFVVAVCGPTLARHVQDRLESLQGPDIGAAELAELAELEQILPTRYATGEHRARHGELSALARQAEKRMRAAPDLAALASLPQTEAKLRERWAGWTVAERRTWLRRVLEYVIVRPATQRGRASDVARRMDPQWKV